MTRLLIVLLLSSCAFRPGEGQKCESSEQCDADLECVPIEEEGMCLPLVERQPTTCGDDADCADALFPVEARCISNACVCEASTCDVGLTFDTRRCVCVDANGAPGDFCNNVEDCDAGLNCDDNTCAVGNGAADRCSLEFECAAPFTCFCPATDPGCAVGLCFVDEGDACNDRVQCAEFAPNCVNGVCARVEGGTGDTCTDDADCSFSACDQGTCG